MCGKKSEGESEMGGEIEREREREREREGGRGERERERERERSTYAKVKLLPGETVSSHDDR